MKAKVKEAFWDKNKRGIRYEVGAIVDFDEERIKNLSTRGLVEIVSEKKKADTASA
ncbi:hypothetical protein LJC39_03335 [Parabacteroides sp. OttesenSCG-928-B22]|nr:hypothetical protein [Parabacteroides sp. OttesenSCG-928-B22]